MMSTFNRGFSISAEELEDILSKEINGNYGSLLIDALTNESIFTAIRDNTLHCYCDGARIIEAKLKNKKFSYNTHYKYLLNASLPVGKEYISIEHGVPQYNSTEELLYGNVDIGKIIKSSKLYVGGEKKGVQKIINANRDRIIDTEIALVGNKTLSGENKKSAFRLDFAALLKQGNSSFLLQFYEAKLFSNAELFAKVNDGKTKVVTQLERYCDLISENEDDIKCAYMKVFENIKTIANVLEKYKKKQNECNIGVNSTLIENLNKVTEKSLIISKKPKLVVYGYSNKDKNSTSKQSINELKKIINENNFELILKGDATGLVLS